MSASTFFRRVSVIVGAGLAVIGVASLLGYSEFPWIEDKRSQTVLLKSVKDVSQLHGAIGTFELVVDTGDKDERMPDMIAGRRTLFVAVGTVNAHVDLAGLAEEDLTLSADGKSVSLRLPEAQLDKPNIDHEASNVVSQERGLLDVISDVFGTPEQDKYFLLAETRMAAAAEKSELRERAAENARSTLAGLFGSLGLQVTFLDEESR